MYSSPSMMDNSFQKSPKTTFRLNYLLVVISGIMIPVGYTLHFAMQSYGEVNYSKMSVQASSPGNVCTKTANSDTNIFCTTAGNAPATDYSRPTSIRYLYQSVTQTLEGNKEEKRKSEKRYADMEKYLRRWVQDKSGHERLKRLCTNRHHLCVYWASIGECERNPVFMETDCILACQRCNQLVWSFSDGLP